ncbi:MAG: hypothetical protein ABSE76_00035 [Minisyncoccia bacterium]|jgi:hypothetical protein
MGNNIWSSQVNLFLSLLFVGSFTLGAGLILWQAFSGHNPITDAMYTEIQAETQTP